MTDEKQIEEMAKVVRKYYSGFSEYKVAEEIYKILIPENAVVLTKEEYEMVLETQKHLEKKYSYMRDELNLYKGENEIIKQNYIQLKQDNEQARKETAREIIDRILWFGVKRIGQSTAESYYQISYERLFELAKQYDVEVEE